MDGEPKGGSTNIFTFSIYECPVRQRVDFVRESGGISCVFIFLFVISVHRENCCIISSFYLKSKTITRETKHKIWEENLLL